MKFLFWLLSLFGVKREVKQLPIEIVKSDSESTHDNYFSQFDQDVLRALEGREEKIKLKFQSLIDKNDCFTKAIDYFVLNALYPEDKDMHVHINDVGLFGHDAAWNYFAAQLTQLLQQNSVKFSVTGNSLFVDKKSFLTYMEKLQKDKNNRAIVPALSMGIYR